MILAGSRPAYRNPIDALHSRTSTILLIDSIVIFFIANSVFSLFVSTSISQIASAVITCFCLIIWYSYKSKADWAYWFAPLIMASATLFFLLLLFLNLYFALTTGEGSWLLVILMAWAAFSSIRFIRVHFHPVYKMGYSGHNVLENDIQLMPNEMLATCPTCLAVLAINPLMLSPNDKCPHCESSLVPSSEEE